MPRSFKFSLLSILSGLSIPFLLLSCQDPKPRTYSEIIFRPLTNAMSGGPMMGGPMSPGAPSAGAQATGAMGPGMMNTSPVDIKVTWTLPDTWVVKDSAKGMRIGSFGIPAPELAHTGELDPRGVDVSVIQLAGDAGGLKANVMRWMGQVGIKATPEELEELLRKASHIKTKTKQDGLVIDLTEKLSGDMTQNKTIYGVIISTADYTVFIKAMGEIERVTKNKNEIKTFTESIAITGPQA